MMKRYHLLLTITLGLCCVGSSYTTNEIPLRVGIFVGIESITLSTNGSKFGLYNYRPATEFPVKVSRRQLLSLTNSLLSKGFADDAPVGYPRIVDVPPQTYEIRIKWAKQEIVRRWYHADGYRVTRKISASIGGIAGEREAAGAEEVH
jgi:hypothetical protein